MRMFEVLVVRSRYVAKMVVLALISSNQGNRFEHGIQTFCRRLAVCDN